MSQPADKNPPATTQPATPPAAPASPLPSLLAKPLRLSMNQDDMVAAIKADPANAARIINALATQNTAEMPDTVFVKRDDSGIVTKTRRTVKLSHAAGELTRLGNKADSPFTISAVGYRKLNSAASLQIFTPSSIQLGEQTVPNPHIELDKAGKLSVVTVRKMCVGAAPDTGNLIATDVMVRFDLNTYMLEALCAKIKYEHKGTSFVGVFGDKDNKPDNAPEGATLRYIPISGDLDLGIWINLSSPFIQSAIAEHVTKMKMAERIAQTFAERNAMKAHPAIPGLVNVNNGVALLSVIGYSHEGGQDKLMKMADLVSKGRIREVVNEIKQIDTVTLTEGHAAEVDMVSQQIAETERESGGAGSTQDTEETDNEPPAVDREQMLAAANKRFSERATGLGTKAAKAEISALTGSVTLAEADTAALQKYLKETTTTK